LIFNKGIELRKHHLEIENQKLLLEKEKENTTKLIEEKDKQQAIDKHNF
jgi:hypothetical protein